MGAALGVRDPLELHVLAATGGGSTVMLAAFDLVGLTPAWIGRTRERVGAATGIAGDRQMYACTHGHGGPETGVLPTMGDPDNDYLGDLTATTVAVAQAALERQTRAEFVVGFGTSFAGVNRRSRAVAPDGPADGGPDDIDPTLIAAQARDGDGRPVVTLVNYGCHPTSSRERIFSADYPGHLRRRVQLITGAPCILRQWGRRQCEPALRGPPSARLRRGPRPWPGTRLDGGPGPPGGASVGLEHGRRGNPPGDAGARGFAEPCQGPRAAGGRRGARRSRRQRT